LDLEAGKDEEEALSNDDEAQSARMKKLEYAVKKQLEFMKDPFHIAAYVKKLLDKESFDEALLMTRKASKHHKMVVGWNHLIDFCMQQQRLHGAIKIYNEMKKRAQQPDAVTYTIIFRGCASSIHPKLAVSEALRIYNTMINGKGVRPSTVHMNAVLDACSRAGDIDSLFTVVSTAKDGVRAPDSLTYTIILNALRHNPDAQRRMDLVDEQVKEANRKTIERARGIWDEVITRWRKGLLNVDETLVCTMGRLLTTMGDYHDNRSVLELVEQTMQIPNFDRAENPAIADGSSKSETKEGPEEKTSAPKKDHLGKGKSTPSIYAVPGKNTLSLIMQAIQATRKTSLAPKYWRYLTAERGVEPDKDNYFRYLRALQVGHNSNKVATLFYSLPQEYMTPIFFRTAFGACITDDFNPNCFENATYIFDIMAKYVRYPDPMAMRLYLQAARANHHPFFVKAKKLKQAAQGEVTEGSPAASADAATKEESTNAPTSSSSPAEAKKDARGPPRPEVIAAAEARARKAYGKQIITALDRMWPVFRVLTTSFTFPMEPTMSPQDKQALEADRRAEVIATARRMVAAISRVVEQELTEDAEIIKTLKARRIILQKLIERHFDAQNKNWDKEYMKKQQQRESADGGGGNAFRSETVGRRSKGMSKPRAASVKRMLRQGYENETENDRRRAEWDPEKELKAWGRE